jgi:hypothetical protein
MADTPIPYLQPGQTDSINADINNPVQPSNVASGAMIQPQDAPQSPSFAPPRQQAPVPNHHEVMGRTLNALMGNQTSYSVDANGNTVETNAPQPPGQLFRSILASALLGGQAGANGNPAQGFTGGLVRGGAASVAQGQQQDLLKRQQAQQQFQNQQKAAQEQREAGAAVTEDQLRKAQIAHANIATAAMNQSLQGATFDQHQKEATAGNQHFADYKEAGLQPIAKDVSETEMTDWIKNRPGAGNLDWEPTGVKVEHGPDGQPTYQMQYTAYDPKGTVPVSKGTIDQWKQDGLFKYHPEMQDIVKPGKELTTQQFIELKRKDTLLRKDAIDRQKVDQDTNEGKARIDLQNAEASRDLAEGGKARREGNKVVLEKTQAQAFNNALTELNKVDGDFDKLSAKSKILIGESTAKMMPGLTQEIRDVLTADPSDSSGQAKELMKELDSMRHLATYSMRGSAQPTTTAAAQPKSNIPASRYDVGTIDKVSGIIGSMPKDQALNAINTSTALSEAEKITLRNKINNPTQPSKPDAMSTLVQNAPSR